MENKKQTILVSFLVPRLRDIVFIFFFYLVLILGTNLFRDGDPGRHITFGRYILSHLTLPDTDIFSYVASNNIFLPPYEWLSQVILGGAYNILGLSGVVIVIAIILAITFDLVYAEMLQRGIQPVLGVIFTFWAATLTMIHWLARPHIFSFLLLALFTPQLARLARGEKVQLWVFPVIMMVWANTHGIFVFAFLSWIAFIAGNLWDSWRAQKPYNNPILQKLILTMGLSALATFINPVGWRLWQYIFSQLGSSEMLDTIIETQTVSFHSVGGFPFLLTIMLIVVILSFSKNRRPAAESFMLAGWLAIGLYGGRNIPLFAISTIPMLAEHVKPFFDFFNRLKRFNRVVVSIEAQTRGRLWSVITFITCVGLLANGVTLDAKKQGYQFNDVEFPVQAVNWIEAHPQEGNMFNYFGWGGYLIYRLWPDYKIFMDGQLVNEKELFSQHAQIVNAEKGWEQVVDQYEITWMLVESRSRIAQTLENSPTWQTLYTDETAVILRKVP